MRFFIALIILAIVVVGCGNEERTKGDKLFVQKKYEEAIKAYDEYLELHPHHVKSLYNRGRSYEELKQFDKAVADFFKVLEEDSKNTAALLSLAEHNYRIDKYDQAKFHAETAVKYNDQLPQAHFWLARSLHKMGLFPDALKSYNNAINLDRQFGEAYLYRGAVKNGLGQGSSACADFKEANKRGVKRAKEAIQKYCK